MSKQWSKIMNNTNDTINKLHDYICKAQEIIYDDNKHIDEFKYNSKYNAADINEKLRALKYIKESFLEDIVTRASGLIGADLMEKAYKYDCNRMRMKSIAMFLVLPALGANPIVVPIAFIISVLIIGFFCFMSFYYKKLAEKTISPVTEYFPDYRQLTCDFGKHQSEENKYKNRHSFEEIKICDGFFNYSYAAETKPSRNDLYYYNMLMFRANIESIKKIRYCESFNLIIIDGDFSLYEYKKICHYDLDDKRDSLKWLPKLDKDTNIIKYSALRLYNYYDQNLLNCLTNAFNMNYELITDFEALEEMRRYPFAI